MAFVCTLDDEIEVTCFEKEFSFIGQVSVGYDDEDELDYSIVVGFEQIPGATEFYFALVEANNNNGQEYFYRDGRLIRAFTTSEQRSKMLIALRFAAKTLVEQAMPETFFFCTIDANLPEKAYAKHAMLAGLFEECGYQVRRADPYHHGKRIWMMERVEKLAVASAGHAP